MKWWTWIIKVEEKDLSEKDIDCTALNRTTKTQIQESEKQSHTDWSPHFISTLHTKTCLSHQPPLRIKWKAVWQCIVGSILLTFFFFDYKNSWKLFLFGSWNSPMARAIGECCKWKRVVKRVTHMGPCWLQLSLESTWGQFTISQDRHTPDTPVREDLARAPIP